MHPGSSVVARPHLPETDCPAVLFSFSLLRLLHSVLLHARKQMSLPAVTTLPSPYRQLRLRCIVARAGEARLRLVSLLERAGVGECPFAMLRETRRWTRDQGRRTCKREREC